MKKILYCSDKPSGRGALPFAVTKTSKLKDVYNKDYPIVVFNEKFLRRRNIKNSHLAGKVCFIHFPEEGNNNLKILKKYNFFDYFTDEDKKRDVLFKLERAEKFLQYKSKVSDLETKLVSKDRKIESLILVDPLTGCYNWRYFLHRAQQELQRARTYHYNISFLVVDMDYFRQINEVYNTKVADAVIGKMVDIFKECLRKEDIICRWREDEFFIILPYVSLNGTCKIAKRIKDKISHHKFRYKNLRINMKVSMGIVSFPEDVISNSRDIVNRLSRCLITAKRRGGNNIVIHSHPKLEKELKEKKKKLGIDELKAKIEKLNILSTRDLLEVIYGFARAIEAKDFYTGRHVEDTASIVEKIARELKFPEAEIENIKPAAVLHDLGKVGIEESILSKKGPLTDHERKMIETHPSIGAEILRGIHILRGMIPAILYHHERYDGKGYPLGLKGEEIPLSARIIAIADVYQALVSDRPYRKAFSREEAIEIIKKESGKQFDPNIVKVFLKVIKKIK
ncbi:MAG: diguanylate cyclase [Candidatus Omnitrophota bacterium]|nr:MAG: diguanylate cyclase [Candidatus Omnitrophota bacterium]